MSASLADSIRASLGSPGLYLAEPSAADQLDPAVYRHIREVTWLTVAMIAIGLPFVAQYYLLDVRWMSAAVLVTIVVGVINVVVLRRTARPVVHGIVGTSALCSLLVLSNIASGGFYDPNFGWLYVMPILAAFAINARGGWAFTALVLALTVGFFAVSEWGALEPVIPVEQHAVQSLFNRLSAVVGLGAILAALASQNAFRQRLLREANQSLSAEMQRRADLTARLVQTERLASMGNVAASVAHEVNNPLAAMKLNLELLLRDETIDPEEAREVATESLEAVRRVELTIDALRTFGLEGPTYAQSSDVEEAVRLATKLTAPLRGEHTDLRQAIASGCCKVRMGHPELVQVLYALLSNASWATREANTDVRTIEVRAHQVADRITVEVEDDGPGIVPEVRERVFEPFFTTRELGQGSGLGLSVARNLVEHAGGSIELQSEPGVRTLVRLELLAG